MKKKSRKEKASTLYQSACDILDWMKLAKCSKVDIMIMNDIIKASKK